MRTPRLTGDAAVFELVDRLNNAFEYPDELGGGGVGFGGGGGGAPTVVVAASDASDLSKSKADFVCPGINDDEVLLTASDQMPSGGRLLLTDGTFDLGAGATLGAGVHLQGMGWGSTILIADFATGPILTVGDLGAVSRLLIMGQSPGLTTVGIGGSSADYVQIDSVMFQFCETCVLLGGDSWTISECVEATVSTSATYFVQDQDTWDRTAVLNNHARGDIDMGDGTDWRVVGNHINSAVSADGGEGGVIAGNIWSDPSSAGAAGAMVDIANFTGLTVASNEFGNASGNDVISLDTVTDATVEANTVVEGADNGIVVASGTRVVVAGNTIIWAGAHGIDYGGNDGAVTGNLVFGSGQNTTNTYDNIIVAGNANLITANTVIPATTSPLTRYGINIASGTSNAVFANMLGDSSVYGTADSVDSGTSTILAASGGVIGGQFAY